MNKLLLTLFLMSSSLCFAKSDQMTLTYSVKRPNTKKLSYWSLYVDTLNEKVSEVISNNFKDILFVITYNHKTNEVNYIDYTKMIIFEGESKNKMKPLTAPIVKYNRQDDCTLYFYKNKNIATLAKCFKERSKYFHFKEMNIKKYKNLVFSYTEKMDDDLLKLPLYDSTLSYEIKKTQKGEIVKKLQSFNFQVMGRNGLKLPKNTYLTKVKKQSCFRLECFGITD